MIHTSLSDQVVSIQKVLVRATLATGQTIYAFQISSYQLVDGDPVLIPGSIFLESLVGDRIEPGIIAAVLPPEPSGSATNIQIWRIDETSWCYSVWSELAQTFEYHLPDGSTFFGDLNALTLVSGGSDRPAPSPVQYQDRTIQLADGDTWKLADVTEIVTGVSIAASIPIKGGTVTIVNTAGTMRLSQSFRHAINAHGDSDRVSGVLEISRNGPGIQVLIGIRVRLPQ